MKKEPRHTKLLTLMLALGLSSVAFVSAAAQTSANLAPRSYTEGEKAKVKGVIIGRDGDLVIIRDKDDAVINAALDNETRVYVGTAWWNTKRSVTNLTPGLRVEVEGRGNSQGQLQAAKVKYRATDMRVAEDISGGITPLKTEVTQLSDQQQKMDAKQTAMQAQQQQMEGQQAEMQIVQQQLRNKQTELQNQQAQTQESLQRTQRETEMLGKRLSEMDEYDTNFTATVKFATGKATLTKEAKLALDELADKALNTQGYLIEVAGHADTTGTKALNQELSQRRADAVIDYLEETKRVPLRRLLTPSGLGTSQPVADNRTKAGRAQNRRVEVKMLVNRGLASMTTQK
ncbi:MAG TPA: OmpA family protein [Blastocatellia bacterium]|nr:OmpA family protein [Blastocatellia bacterium]